MIEQIFFGVVGVALLVLTFRLVHKDKFAFAFFVFIAALASFLLTATWFQGLMKTGVISSVVSTLKLYGNRLDNFQETVASMEVELTSHQNQIRTQQGALSDQEAKIKVAQTEISNQQTSIGKQQDAINTHQTSIANQYQRIAEIQNSLAFAQTNLDKQEKQIEDVAFLVKNIFSKTVTDSFNGCDSNHVSRVDGGDVQRIVFKLDRVPIANSVQGLFSENGQGQSPMLPDITQHKNVLIANFTGNWDSWKNKTFSLRYVQDTRETNLIRYVYVSG